MSGRSASTHRRRSPASLTGRAGELRDPGRRHFWLRWRRVHGGWCKVVGLARRHEDDVPAGTLGIVEGVVGPFGDQLRGGTLPRESDTKADRHHGVAAIGLMNSGID